MDEPSSSPLPPPPPPLPPPPPTPPALPPPPDGEPVPGRRRDPGPFTRAVLIVGLVAVVAFWALLLVSDDDVSPFAFADPADDVFLALAIVHVVSAPVAWIAALRVTVRRSRPGWTVFGAAVVPVTAILSLLVLMTDAVVWRDDLGGWVLAMGLALLGPATLVVSLAAALRMTGRDGTPE